ncbi:hypothetical protein [Sorangium sp. So ce233]|uniref:hypothetical protein n=1 Tax=Sorangium sp. So ce233 TaxID=3133290 RepID=UPI003F5F6631
MKKFFSFSFIAAAAILASNSAVALEAGTYAINTYGLDDEPVELGLWHVIPNASAAGNIRWCGYAVVWELGRQTQDCAIRERKIPGHSSCRDEEQIPGADIQLSPVRECVGYDDLGFEVIYDGLNLVKTEDGALGTAHVEGTGDWGYFILEATLDGDDEEEEEEEEEEEA